MPVEILKNHPVLATEFPAFSRPKVLHLLESFHQGGTERQALQLVELLRQDGTYDVSLATLQPSGILREQASASFAGPIPSFPLTSFYNLQFLTQLRRFAAHLRESQISIVHTHDFYTNIFGMAAARIAGVPVRIASRRDLGIIRTAAQRYVERRAYWISQRIVANCEGVRQQLIREGVPPQKIAVIYNGQNPERVVLPTALNRNQALHRLDLPQARDRQVVTIVANFRLAAKDQATFLRAAQRVLQQMPETMFVLAGEGERQAGMCKLAEELGLRNRALFIGRCDRIAELLAVSDVCVLSSTSEGFSNSVLEYMAAGRPVVATDVGGTREAVVEGETGYLVQPGDHTAMSERMVNLLRDPETAARMGQRGYDRVANLFSRQRQTESTKGLYAELLTQEK